MKVLTFCVLTCTGLSFIHHSTSDERRDVIFFPLTGQNSNFIYLQKQKRDQKSFEGTKTAKNKEPSLKLINSIPTFTRNELMPVSPISARSMIWPLPQKSLVLQNPKGEHWKIDREPVQYSTSSPIFTREELMAAASTGITHQVDAPRNVPIVNRNLGYADNFEMPKIFKKNFGVFENYFGKGFQKVYHTEEEGHQNKFYDILDEEKTHEHYGDYNSTLRGRGRHKYISDTQKETSQKDGSNERGVHEERSHQDVLLDTKEELADIQHFNDQEANSQIGSHDQLLINSQNISKTDYTDDHHNDKSYDDQKHKLKSTHNYNHPQRPPIFKTQSSQNHPNLNREISGSESNAEHKKHQRNMHNLNNFKDTENGVASSKYFQIPNHEKPQHSKYNYKPPHNYKFHENHLNNHVHKPHNIYHYHHHHHYHHHNYYPFPQQYENDHHATHHHYPSISRYQTPQLKVRPQDTGP